MRETLEQLTARVNASAYIPPLAKGDRVMAKQVKLSKGKEFTFKSGGTTVGKYPWNEWFNGDLLLLEKNATGADGKVIKRDFDVDVLAMPAKIKTAARRRYKIVQTSFRDADGNKLTDSIIIRARDMTADERVAEDMRRAEEKAAKKRAAVAATPTTTATEALPTRLNIA